jgi:hypothetical protein
MGLGHRRWACSTLTLEDKRASPQAFVVFEKCLAAGQVKSRTGVRDFVEGHAELAHRYIMLAAQLLDLLELLGRELRSGNDQLFNATVLEDFRKNHE